MAIKATGNNRNEAVTPKKKWTQWGNGERRKGGQNNGENRGKGKHEDGQATKGSNVLKANNLGKMVLR